MIANKLATKNKKPNKIHIGDPEDREGKLKAFGGSRSDNWNNILANQVAQSLWVANSDKASREIQYQAALSGAWG